MAVATDYIITDADKNAVNVASQPTTLKGSAAQNKQVFDNYCDLIKDRFNSLCSFVNTEISATVDYDVKVLYASLGWVDDSGN